LDHEGSTVQVMAGWDRASFEMNTKPDRVERDIGRPDLMLPAGFGAKLLAECLACGLLMAMGFLWIPLTIVAFAHEGHAPWFWPTIGGASLGTALFMFVYVRRDVKDFIVSIDES
jgi:hypothetical protein